jgi:hypothetical protein
MIDNAPSKDEWNRLYNLMSEIQKISPWDWLEEQDIFLVQDPETGELGFVSVMGELGEHYAITAYRGEEGLRLFQDFKTNFVEGDESAMQILLEMPQLQASFEDRNFLHKEDRDVIKELSLTFRGKSAWPMFRSYVPGFVPWFLESAEARFLACILEQTIDVSLRAAEHPDLLRPGDDASYLLRTRVGAGNSLRWRDSVWRETVVEPVAPEATVDLSALETLRRTQKRNIALEIDIFMFPSAIREKDAKPYYPYVLTLIDTGSDMIVGHEMISPVPSLSAMWQRMPSIVANNLIFVPIVPERIYVDSEALYRCLLPLCDRLDVSLQYVDALRLAPEVRRTLRQFLDGNLPGMPIA